MKVEFEDKEALVNKWYDAFNAWMIVCYGKEWRTSCEMMEMVSRQIGFLAGYSACADEVSK